MKLKLLFILSIISLSINAQEVTHIDFDTYNANVVFNSWNTSSTFAKISNPVSNSDNPSAFVGQFTAGDNNDIGIGVIDPTTVFTSPFNLESNSIFKMKVFSTEEIDVVFHLENSPDWGNFIEVTASVGPADINQWVELTFDFSSFSNIFMNNIVIKIGGPNTSQGDIYFFDDILGPELYTAPAQQFSPADGEIDTTISTNLEITTNDSFRNLDDSEITNLSSNDAVYVVDENGMDVPFSASINQDKNKITINPSTDLDNSTIYSYGIINGSIEYSDDTTVMDVYASFTTKAAVIGDINEMLFDFDTTNTNIGFESWGGVGFAVIENPDVSGINVSDHVGEYTYNGGSAGLENSLVNGVTPLLPLDFAETPFIKVKVWVNKPVGVSIRLQNYPDYGQGEEQTIEVTEINTWVELIFNYGAVTATNYDRAQIYFDKDGNGGSSIGDTYYFDDYLKSNIAPAVQNTMSPEDNATDVSQTTKPVISSNFQFRNIDNSTIADASTVVELRENNATGTLVAMTASLSTNNSAITIRPDVLLSPNTTYWYGIKENTVEYAENEELVSGVSATFTTTSTAINFVTYDDFDGTSLSTIIESMGDPAAPFTTVTDPAGGSNMVKKWEKGNSWGGWERIHLQLNAPYDAAQDDIFSFRVYSPVTTGIRFKVADARDDSEINAQYETDEEIIFENQWQTVYLNTSELADGVEFDHIFIFLGRGDTPNTTFYIDDIMGPQLQGTASVSNFDKPSFEFFPNPTKDILYFPNLDGKKDIRIFDINSKQIFKKTIHSNELSIRNLKPGLYFLQVNGQFKKLIKQ